jgi:RHS repeat-associated protein
MEWESESSLYHTWFRQYDPSQGRWMSVDPLAGTTDNPQSQDRYVYVLDDPVNLTDPLGLFMARPPHCERDGMEVLGIFCDPDRPGGRPSPGGEGPGRGPEDETGGGGGKHECWAKARRYASRRCGLTA